MQAIRLGQLEMLMFLFVGLTLLMLVGLMVYVASARRRKQQAATRPRSQPVRMPEPQSVPASQNPYAGAVPALSLFRSPSGGPIRVEMDGAVYSTMAEVADPDLKRKIIGLAMELIQFVGVLKGQQPAVADLDKTETWREDLRADSQVARAQAQSALRAGSGSAAEAQATSDVEERFLALLAEMGQGQSTLQKPSLMRSIQKSLQPKPVSSEGGRSFVHDIEEIVQGRLQANPELVRGGLHIQTGLDGRVTFVFDGHEYASVDEIPNQAAQELIRSSIREWDALS